MIRKFLDLREISITYIGETEQRWRGEESIGGEGQPKGKGGGAECVAWSFLRKSRKILPEAYPQAYPVGGEGQPKGKGGGAECVAWSFLRKSRKILPEAYPQAYPVAWGVACGYRFENLENFLNFTKILPEALPQA
ncbi:hypothetical protein T07_4896 [Trichinella nelsoni]|uniref:Uncharacterized protein n=1 Tax=Trichinella nelsoni TaxID=6336 RepID=A0A0V0SAG6_9BILA|nr:hypothetical protein T07_4896 [Trichinella nelsoni]